MTKIVNYFFSLETTARELNAKILLAVNKNRKIFIGEQQFLRNLSHIIMGGIFYGKHLFGKPRFSDIKYYNRLKKNNFNVLHLNKEGSIWTGGEKEWKRTFYEC